MSAYRRGTILGLTVAEIFILLAFLLLIALLGLVQQEELSSEPAEVSAPGVWVRPERIETLVNAAKRAHATAERERNQAQRNAEQARKAQEDAEQARKAQEDAEQARAAAERDRDQARDVAEQARKAQEDVEQARAAAERERDQARDVAEQARKAQEDAEQARTAAERERDQIQRDLSLLRRKGVSPPCWYETIPAGDGKTREKSHYVFGMAIYENGIELCKKTPPPGGALDDGGGPYEAEWKQLQIEELPYGTRLTDREFTEAVTNLVAQGRRGLVRTYQCVFSVKVWDMTPEHAKKRWKHAHDRIIEARFSAYTVQDDEWEDC